jgi:translation elongation factor EF-Tu-like GTPase
MINNIAYNFTAILTLLPTQNGGRKRPVFDNYRPSFSFSSKNLISGEISFPEKDQVDPGTTAIAHIKLLPSKIIRHNLKSGDSFTILEGNKLVGTGVIKDILEEKMN